MGYACHTNVTALTKWKNFSDWSSYHTNNHSLNSINSLFKSGTFFCSVTNLSALSKLTGRWDINFVPGRVADTCGCKCRNVKKNSSFHAPRFARNPARRISFRKSTILSGFCNSLITRSLNARHPFLTLPFKPHDFQIIGFLTAIKHRLHPKTSPLAH